jgi:hypothetical protein
MSEADPPKIIIDDDWKAQAQAEKAKLVEQEQANAAGPAGDPAAGAPAGTPGAPSEQIGFNDLVQVLASQALMYMGAVPDPQTGKAVVSPPMAKAHIDLLGIVEEKTKGNLDEEETKLLEGILYELRMQFVELGKAIDQAIQEGKLSPQQAGEMGMPSTQPPANPG